VARAPARRHHGGTGGRPREAVHLGYAIEADDGPTGRLRHWAISGVPAEALAVHSKRAAEITAEMDRLGYSSYVAKHRGRDTRARKRHEPVGTLMPRWHAELESLGWPVAELSRSVEQASARSRRPQPLPASNSAWWPRCWPPTAHWPSARSSTAGTSSWPSPPVLFGHQPHELDQVVDRVLANPESVPLVAVPSACERPLCHRHHHRPRAGHRPAVDIEMARRDAPVVHDMVARQALAAREAELGASLTVGSGPRYWPPPPRGGGWS
jgi:hypothetical protein